MKKILLIADSNMSLSGVPVVFMSIVRLLSKDYQFDIIVLKDNDMYFEKEFLSYGGKVFRYKFEKPNNFFKKLIWIKFSYYKNVKKFIKNNIKLGEYTAVHSFQEDYSYPFLGIAKRAGIKRIVLHINSAASAYDYSKKINRKVLDMYRKKAIKKCSNVIFVSKRALELNDYKHKGVVIYNTYDDKIYNDVIECCHNNLVLTQIGTLSSRKNQLFSLSVIKHLKEKYPDVILKIIGSELEKGYMEEIKSYICKNKLENNVEFLNPSTNKIKLFKETSFIIMPSTMESFGLVLLEGQASGIHCFASDNIPNDANMGNIEFVKPDSSLWANKIFDYFKLYGNKREKPINRERFGEMQFKNSLYKIYEK